MKTFSSLSAVMGLWLAVSFSLWLGYRTFRRRDNSRQRKLVDDAVRLIDEGTTIFGAIRKAPAKAIPFASPFVEAASRQDEDLRQDVRLLLNAIEANSVYFDRVNATKKRLQQAFELPDFQPLAELLQVRRDFWAASEVLLIEDIQDLGVELANKSAYDAFRLEAISLLFGDGNPAETESGHRDVVALRLSLARDEIALFLIEVEKTIAAERDKNKLPRLSEVLVVPWRIMQAAAGFVRETRYLIGDLATTARGLAHAMTSRGLAGAAQDLRKARSDLPSQFATAFERAGGTARQGGQDLKRHYEFLLEARELRARYAELLAKKPDITEKGKQFVTRLELEKRAEQFRETSEGAVALARRQLVVGIAYIIAGLQIVQAKVTPRQNKQLAMLPPDPVAPQAQSPADPALSRKAPPPEPIDAPLRALLPPAAPRKPADSPRQTFTRLRDRVGNSTTIDAKAEATQKPKKEIKPAAPPKPRYSYSEGMKKMSFKDLLKSAETEPVDAELLIKPEPRTGSTGPKKAGPPVAGGSLLDRLSSVEAKQVVDSPMPAPVAEAQKIVKKSRFKLF